MPMRPLDEGAIRALASKESFERGRDYWRRGSVSALVRRGDELVAEVEGSEIAPYRVTTQLYADGGIAEARCTCPYDRGGYCKHIVATLLKFAEDPGKVTKRPPLRDMLSTLDRDALIDLIVKRLDHDPDLATWIESEFATSRHRDHDTPVDPAPLAAHAHTLLAGRRRQRRYWDDYRPSGDAEELHALVDKAVPFLEAGDGRNALRILEAVAEVFVDDWLDNMSGTDEHMYTLFADLGQMMAEAVLMSDLNREERDSLTTSLEDWQDRLDEFGVGEGFGVALCALESGWDQPALQAVLAGEQDTFPPNLLESWEEQELTMVRLRVLDACGRTDAYLNLAHAAGARTSVTAMLARLGRTPEALVYARKYFAKPDESLEFAKILRETGSHDEALAIAEAGLSLGRHEPEIDSPWATWPVVPLARWLRDYAGPMGRQELALTAARIAFEHSLSFEDYRTVENWAGETWSGVRKDLLARLKAAERAPDRTEILLSEGLIDDAVRSVGEGTGYEARDDILMRLMDAAHATHPDWVIRLAERRANRIIDAGSTGSYELAAKWLERAVLAYDADGRFEEWSTVIEGLIDKHRRKYKLRPLLEALRNGP